MDSLSHFDNHTTISCNVTISEKSEFAQLDPQNPRSRELNLNNIRLNELNLNTH